MDVVSFTINHDKLLPGVYISRKDEIGAEVLTTFDVRMKHSNKEPVLGNPEIHTMEHLMAVYMRSEKSGWADKLIYIGPMGCRTGMYMIVKGDVTPKEVVPLLIDTFKYIKDFDQAIPATTSIECGNYLDHNLAFARCEAQKYLDILNNITEDRMVYPV